MLPKNKYTNPQDQELFGFEGLPTDSTRSPERQDQLEALRTADGAFTVGEDANENCQYDTTTDVATDMWWKTFTHQHGRAK